MNRNRLFAGGAIAVLLILILVGLLLLRAELQSRQTQVNQREPLQGLAYCDATQVTPCIVSFSRDAKGRMLVNILTDRSFPDFYLKIIHEDGESIYPCQEVERFSTSVYCTGKILALGEIFQFYLLSVDDNSLLAQGNFSIIGMSLASADTIVSTAAAVTPSPALFAVSGTAGTPTITLTPGRVTPTRTPTPTRTSSYPNYP